MKYGKILLLSILLIGSFVYILGCIGGSSSGGTVSNPVGPSSGGAGSQPTFEQEQAALNTQVNSFAAACSAKDVEKALTYISPSFKEQYKGLFQENPQKNAYSC